MRYWSRKARNTLTFSAIGLPKAAVAMKDLQLLLGLSGAVLWGWVGSSSFRLMVAVLLPLCTVSAVTCSVMPTLAPAARVPRLQATVPFRKLQLPASGAADTYVTPPGSTSVTVTPVASSVLLLVTVML